jgi:hypothetical protein
MVANPSSFPSSFTMKAKDHLLLKLQGRETHPYRPSNAYNKQRSYCRSVFPISTATVEMPDYRIQKFSPDGKYLICFSKNQHAIQLFRYSPFNWIQQEYSDRTPEFKDYFTSHYEKTVNCINVSLQPGTKCSARNSVSLPMTSAS